MLKETYCSLVLQRSGKPIMDDFTMKNIGKVAKWLTGNYKPGLLLYGSVGNGKTTMARAICTLIGILYSSARFVNERTVVTSVSALNLAKIAKDEADKYDSLKNADLLFVDDVGCEPAVVKVWGNEVSPVTELIYHRYDLQKFTIMTSNLGDKDFDDRYGGRVADRLIEMFDRIYYDSKSYRK